MCLEVLTCPSTCLGHKKFEKALARFSGHSATWWHLCKRATPSVATLSGPYNVLRPRNVRLWYDLETSCNAQNLRSQHILSGSKSFLGRYGWCLDKGTVETGGVEANRTSQSKSQPLIQFISQGVGAGNISQKV